MSQDKPTHAELLEEQHLLTDGVESDPEWCCKAHDLIFHEDKPTVILTDDLCHIVMTRADAEALRSLVAMGVLDESLGDPERKAAKALSDEMSYVWAADTLGEENDNQEV